MLVKCFLLVWLICVPHNLIHIHQIFKSTSPKIGFVDIVAKTTSFLPSILPFFYNSRGFS